MRIRSLVFCATALLVLCCAGSASAEETMWSKLNPFGSSKPAASSKQHKTFPGFSSHTTKKKAEPSMLGKTVDSVSQGTKSAWNKTTTMLSPSNLFSTSSAKSSSKSAPKKSTSSWSPLSAFQASEPQKEPETLSDFLKLPHNKP